MAHLCRNSFITSSLMAFGMSACFFGMVASVRGETMQSKAWVRFEKDKGQTDYRDEGRADNRMPTASTFTPFRASAVRGLACRRWLAKSLPGCGKLRLGRIADDACVAV